MARSHFFFVALILASLIAGGCGGGGGGGATPPTPPPPPPPVEIGRGPGPAADAIPAEPAINTMAARNAPMASAPDAAFVRPAVLDRMDCFASSPPASTAELQALLDDFTGWVTQQPNDAAAQAGLATALLLAGAYNAGIDAGYTPAQLLGLLEPVTQIASLKHRGGLFAAAESWMARYTLPRQLAAICQLTPAQDFPNPSDPDFSTADLQIGVRRFLLPMIPLARARLQAVGNGAASATAPLVQFGPETNRLVVYRAEVHALIGISRLIEAWLLQACAYQFNGGDWDWNVQMRALDDDGDGLLTVAEYLPPDPFLWRHQSTNMRDAGAEIERALTALIAGVDATRAGSLLERALGETTAAAEKARLSDLLEMTRGQVSVTLLYAGGTTSAGSRSAQMNLSRLWSAPPDDIKDLMPTLELASGSAWQALPRGASDFPDPTLGGIFPQPAPLMEILSGGPAWLAVSYGAVDELTVFDRR